NLTLMELYRIVITGPKNFRRGELFDLYLEFTLDQVWPEGLAAEYILSGLDDTEFLTNTRADDLKYWVANVIEYFATLCHIVTRHPKRSARENRGLRANAPKGGRRWRFEQITALAVIDVIKSLLAQPAKSKR